MVLTERLKGFLLGRAGLYSSWKGWGGHPGTRTGEANRGWGSVGWAVLSFNE